MKKRNQFFKFLLMFNLILQSLILNAQTNTNKGEIYVFESNGNGFNTKTIFYDDGKEVVAFDAQFTEAAAQEAIDFLKTKTNHPIKWLVITHPNPDKFNGIPTFKKEGAKVIMSNLTAQYLKGVHEYKKYYFVHIAKMFTDETYPKLPSTDITFDENYTINLANGSNIELKEFKMSGVSLNQTVAYLPSINSLIVGDLIHYNAHAWLEGPIVNGNAAYNSQNWIDVLKKIQNLYQPNTIVYGGRGQIGILSVVIPQQIEYLKQANEIVRNYINSLNGKDLKEKKSKIDYAGLTKVFEKQFPNYTLSYMITYGAYGIVASMQ